MFRLSQIQRHISNGNTLLGVGPMSKECVDRVIHLANTYCKPILLIASRRQIDSEEFGGGYVNNWSTKSSLVTYVVMTKKDVFCWLEIMVDLAESARGIFKFSLVDALDSAKRSFREIFILALILSILIPPLIFIINLVLRKSDSTCIIFAINALVI